MTGLPIKVIIDPTETVKSETDELEIPPDVAEGTSKEGDAAPILDDGAKAEAKKMEDAKAKEEKAEGDAAQTDAEVEAEGEAAAPAEGEAAAPAEGEAAAEPVT